MFNISVICIQSIRVLHEILRNKWISLYMYYLNKKVHKNGKSQSGSQRLFFSKIIFVALQIFHIVGPPLDSEYRISTICFLVATSQITAFKLLRNSSLLTMKTLNSAFKYISFIHFDAYK